jgi:hypothetical protein
MKRQNLEAPRRLVEVVPAPSDRTHTVITDELRRLSALPQFDREDRLRIRRRLHAATSATTRSRWRPVFVGVLIFLIGSTVGASIVQQVVNRKGRSAAKVEDRRLESDRRKYRQGTVPTSDAAVPAADAPADIPPPSPPEQPSVGKLASAANHGAAPTGAGGRMTAGGEAKRHAQLESTRPSPTTVNPPALRPEGAEQLLLAEVLLKLRHLRDPRAALQLLNEHDRRFPHGLLGTEAALARVDALLALDRRDDALAVLDGIAFTGSVRAGELQVLRGELRAKRGRCLEAIDDFSAILSTGRPDLDERALFGRSGCRARMGDVIGARADLDAYATLFPHGRFIDAVHKARLSRTP